MYSNRNQPRVVAEEDELPVNDELFLSPIQKYKIYGKFPYKMVIHSLLVICTSLQVLLLLSTNTNYTRAQERLFYDAFVTESDKTTYDENGTQNKYVMKIGIGSINAMIITYPMDKEEEYKNMVNAIIGNFTPGDLSASY